MNPDIRRICDPILREVLEEYAYMMVDESSGAERLTDTGSGYIQGMITFDGPRTGVVEVITTSELTYTMAANVLGIGLDQVSQTVAEDAFKEFVNVVCGRLTAALTDERAVFSITIPSCQKIDHGKWNELCAQPDGLALKVDGRPMVTEVIVDDTAG